MFHNDLKNLVDDKIPAAFVFFALLLFADHLCNSAIFVLLAKWKQKNKYYSDDRTATENLACQTINKTERKKNINDTSK